MLTVARRDGAKLAKPFRKQSTNVQQILDAIQAGDTSSEDFASIEIPDSYQAITVHKDEQTMFEGIKSRDKDPRKSLHLDEVAVPELGPGEAIVAVMASAINYNTVWSSIFEPVSTFSFLERYGRLSPLTKRHDLPYHIVGSDLAGVVLRTGPGVTAWKPGDEVVAHCLSVELEDPAGHNDTMMDPQQRIWGFETNFGGLAELALVKSAPEAASVSVPALAIEAPVRVMLATVASRVARSRVAPDAMVRAPVAMAW